MVIVTVPALAESADLLNFKLPLGSADRLSLLLAAADEELDPVVLVEDAGVLAAAAGVVLGVDELLPPPPPHPAAASAATAAPRTRNFGMRVKDVPPDRVSGKTRGVPRFFPVVRRVPGARCALTKARPASGR